MTLLGAMALMALWLAAALPQAGSPAPPAPPAATARLSPAALRAVPWPELAGLEPAVQEALQQGSAGFTAAVAAGAVEAGGGAQVAEAYGELGRLFHAHGFSAAAETCYDNAGRLARGDFRWPHLRGLVLLDEQRSEAAAAAFAEAFARRPYYPALLRQARVEQELGHLEAAQVLLAVATAHSPNDPALLAVLGDQAGLTGRNAEAIELLERALQAAPGATRLHYPLALAYRAVGNGAAADAHLALAGRVGIVPLDPLENEVRSRRVGATVWDLEGQRALQAGDAPAAVKAFRKALEARPGDPELRARLSAAERTDAAAFETAKP